MARLEKLITAPYNNNPVLKWCLTNTGIMTAHVIRYNGVLYDITRIDNFEGRKEDLKLYCARRARQNL